MNASLDLVKLQGREFRMIIIRVWSNYYNVDLASIISIEFRQAYIQIRFTQIVAIG